MFFAESRRGTPIAGSIGMLFTSNPPVEARAWLRQHLDGFAFAPNRFQRTANALAFVDRLYEEGATEVLVDNPREAGDGSPHADTLLVRFPPDGETRWRLLKFCEREGPDQEVPDDFVLIELAEEFQLWWD
jgi:hypothetical protein